MKKFSPKAAFLFAALVRKYYIDSDDIENFLDDIENFMSVYERDDGTDDDDKPVEKRAEPVIGEVYKDVFGHKIRVVATRSIPAYSSEVVVLFSENDSGFETKTYTLKLEEFMNAHFVKEVC